MSTAKNPRSVYIEQIAHIWASFDQQQQTWAMLKMSADLRATLNNIIADTVAIVISRKDLLDQLKTPTTVPAPTGYSIMDQIRGGPELRLVEFLQALQQEQP